MTEIVWQLKDVLVATWFTMIETTTFLVTREPTLSPKMAFGLSWLEVDLGWPYINMMQGAFASKCVHHAMMDAWM